MQRAVKFISRHIILTQPIVKDELAIYDLFSTWGCFMKGYQIVLGLVAFGGGMSSISLAADNVRGSALMGKTSSDVMMERLYKNDEKYLTIQSVEITEISEEELAMEEVIGKHEMISGVFAGTGPRPRPAPSPIPRRRGTGGGPTPIDPGSPPPIDPGDIDLPEPFPGGGNPGPIGGGGYFPPIGGGFGGGGTSIIIDQIINIGRQIWEIIQANRPQVNYKRDTASAVPTGVVDWTQLQGWSPPVSKAFRATYKNFLGNIVVDFPFRVLYTWGGNAMGKGKFLTNVTIAPKDLRVAWDFKFDASVEIASVTNAGTHDEPVGAIEIMIHWAANSSFKHMEGSESFYVRGDGQFNRVVDSVR